MKLPRATAMRPLSRRGKPKRMDSQAAGPLRSPFLPRAVRVDQPSGRHLASGGRVIGNLDVITKVPRHPGLTRGAVGITQKGDYGAEILVRFPLCRVVLPASGQAPAVPEPCCTGGGRWGRSPTNRRVAVGAIEGFWQGLHSSCFPSGWGLFWP